MKILPIGHLVKTNPIQTQTNPILSAVGGLQMNVSSLITKDYRKNDDFAVRKNKPNSNPISKEEEYMVICSELLATETQYPAVFHRKVQPPVRCGHAIENRQRFEFVFGKHFLHRGDSGSAALMKMRKTNGNG